MSASTNKHHIIEIFSANCPLCRHIIDDIKISKCEGCKQIVYDINNLTNEIKLKMRDYVKTQKSYESCDRIFIAINHA